jgi:hypothetical protein
MCCILPGEKKNEKFRIQFTCTGTNTEADRIGMASGILSVTSNGAAKVEELSILDCPSLPRQNCEKNWLPFMDQNGNMRLIYSWDPFIVLDFEGTVVSSTTPKVCLKQLRGSAPPVALNGGNSFLGKVHQVNTFGNKRRYLHRFLLFNANYELTHMTFAFNLGAEPEYLEYCLGMVISKGNVVLTFGVNDERAYLMSIPLETILTSLKPLDSAAWKLDNLNSLAAIQKQF